MDDELIFAEEEKDLPADELIGDSDGAWKVMIVDDQEDMHVITRLVLEDFTFEGRKVTCLSAYSGAEAKELVEMHPDTAVMLLDVVMETRRAGLEVARFIREDIRNQFVRIILRTGQPGEAPEREVVTELDINDYRHKTDLTADRLVTSVTTAIRSYRDLKIIEEGRRGLHLLAMSVAHQVRNRTVAIAGFANIVRRKVPSEVEGYLDTILLESARLENMVRDVTQYASIEIAELTLTSIRDVIEDVMVQIDAGVAASGGSVEWDVLCPDQVVLVDPKLFAMTMQAILQNGVDFSGSHPRIRIVVSPGRLACVIKVTDFGSGIEEAHRPFIFDPFFSVKPKGAGMGLCVARRVAMEHQWDLDVISSPGEGTTVRIVIPRRELTG